MSQRVDHPSSWQWNQGREGDPRGGLRGGRAAELNMAALSVAVRESGEGGEGLRKAWVTTVEMSVLEAQGLCPLALM